MAGDPKATDREIMDWARENAHVVFKHDLDFGTMLALTHAAGAKTYCPITWDHSSRRLFGNTKVIWSQALLSSLTNRNLVSASCQFESCAANVGEQIVERERAGFRLFNLNSFVYGD